MASSPNAVDSATILSARTRRASGSEHRLIRGLQLWHLLSLDAPTVAMLWTWFLARTNRIELPPTSILAMGIAVWMLYAADRLLDARSLEVRTSVKAVVLSEASNHRISSETLPSHSADLEPRHYFHRLHQTPFRLGILASSAALALLLPELAPQSIRLYLALGTLLFGYFVIIHVNSEASPAKAHRLPKELAVGIFFSAATFIPTVARNPAVRFALLPGAILFAALCSLNCLFIYTWEHPAASLQTHPATRIALRFLPSLAGSVAIVGLILCAEDHSLPWPVPIACTLATVLLLVLHYNRDRLFPTTLRAAADLCLLTPLLLLYR